MPLNAFKDGVTVLNEDNINALLHIQPFQLVYTGAQRDAKIGSGVVENNVANYSYCARFTLTGSTEIGRVELEIDRDNLGSDLVLQIREGMDPANGVDGTLLKQVVVPKEFIPETAAYWSVPVGLSGLTSNSQYWVMVLIGGDATNHLDWVGEASPDASYPAYYRAGNSGAWTANNALHFKVFSGENGKLVHSIYADTAHSTVIYNGNKLDKIHVYIPPADGYAGGIRDTLTYTWVNNKLKGGA